MQRDSGWEEDGTVSELISKRGGVERREGAGRLREADNHHTVQINQ